jgi:hypothetical protein
MMKNTIIKIGALALLVAPLAMALPAAAATNWDTSGNYVVSFDGYSHDMTLAQDGLDNLTGSGGYMSGSPYTYAWTVTSGTVVGDTINITADYTLGAVGTTMHMVGTIAANGTMSGTWDDNYGGSTRVGTWSTTSGAATVDLAGSLAAEDFGVVSYDSGLGMISGYTAGFGLTDATFAGAQSVVVKLYSGATLLQTNTAILPKFNADITGTQFSSPFDVSGTFAYATDGYWTNVREAQYGQSVAATRVVATVTLANGKVVTAENTAVTGDPTTIYPAVDTTPDAFVFVDQTGVALSTTEVSNVITVTGINAATAISVAGGEYSVNGGAYTTVSSTVTSGAMVTVRHTSSAAFSTSVNTVLTVGGVTDTFTSTTVTTPVVPSTPTDKDQCKNDGWKTFANPSFKNQGQCVSSTVRTME